MWSHLAEGCLVGWQSCARLPGVPHIPEERQVGMLALGLVHQVVQSTGSLQLTCNSGGHRHSCSWPRVGTLTGGEGLVGGCRLPRSQLVAHADTTNNSSLNVFCKNNRDKQASRANRGGKKANNLKTNFKMLAQPILNLHQQCLGEPSSLTAPVISAGISHTKSICTAGL